MTTKIFRRNRLKLALILVACTLCGLRPAAAQKGILAGGTGGSLVLPYPPASGALLSTLRRFATTPGDVTLAATIPALKMLANPQYDSTVLNALGANLPVGFEVFLQKTLEQAAPITPATLGFIAETLDSARQASASVIEAAVESRASLLAAALNRGDINREQFNSAVSALGPYTLYGSGVERHMSQLKEIQQAETLQKAQDLANLLVNNHKETAEVVRAQSESAPNTRRITPVIGGPLDYNTLADTLLALLPPESHVSLETDTGIGIQERKSGAFVSAILKKQGPNGALGLRIAEDKLTSMFAESLASYGIAIEKSGQPFFYWIAPKFLSPAEAAAHNAKLLTRTSSSASEKRALGKAKFKHGDIVKLAPLYFRAGANPDTVNFFESGPVRAATIESVPLPFAVKGPDRFIVEVVNAQGEHMRIEQLQLSRDSGVRALQSLGSRVLRNIENLLSASTFRRAVGYIPLGMMVMTIGGLFVSVLALSGVVPGGAPIAAKAMAIALVSLIAGIASKINLNSWH
jgi:hypothetical protein